MRYAGFDFTASRFIHVWFAKAAVIACSSLVGRAVYPVKTDDIRTSISKNTTIHCGVGRGVISRRRENNQRSCT